MSVDLGTIGYTVKINDSDYEKQLRGMDADAKQTANNIGGYFEKAIKVGATLLALNKVISVTKEFKNELRSVMSIQPDLDASKLENAIMSIDSRFGHSAEIANATFTAYSSGVEGTEKEVVSFTGEIARLNKTIRGDLLGTMNAITTLTNAYGIKARDAGIAADWMFQVIKSGKATATELSRSLGMGVSTAASGKVALDDFGASIATLSLTMPASQAITSLNQAMLSFINPTVQAKEVASKYGIEMSANALKIKGWTGALEEIRSKVKDTGDLAKIFSSSEALKAVLALTGDQWSQYNKILGEFKNKTGAAKEGFDKFMEGNDKERLEMMSVAFEKIMVQIGSVVSSVVTLNGALDPFYQMLGNLSSGTTRWLGVMIATVAGLIGLRKAFSAMGGIKNNFVKTKSNLAYKVGFADEVKAAQIAASQKILIQQREDAAISALNARRMMQYKALKAREVAEDKKSSASKIALAQTELTAARQKYNTERSMALMAQQNLAANRAVLAQVKANIAGTGMWSVAVHTLKGAFKSLWATMVANPITAILTIATTAFSFFLFFSERAKQKVQEAAEAAAKAVSEAKANTDKAREDQKIDMLKMGRLQQLAAKQKLTNDEMKEAQKIASELKGKYGDIGIEFDTVNGKINIMANSIQNLVSAMNQKLTLDMEKELKVMKQQLEAAKENVKSQKSDKINNLYSKYVEEDSKNGELPLLTSRSAPEYTKMFNLAKKRAELNVISNDPEVKKLQEQIAEAKRNLADLKSGKSKAPGDKPKTATEAATDAMNKDSRERNIALMRKQISVMEDGDINTVEKLALSMQKVIDLKKELAVSKKMMPVNPSLEQTENLMRKELELGKAKMEQDQLRKELKEQELALNSEVNAESVDASEREIEQLKKRATEYMKLIETKLKLNQISKEEYDRIKNATDTSVNRKTMEFEQQKKYRQYESELGADGKLDQFDKIKLSQRKEEDLDIRIKTLKDDMSGEKDAERLNNLKTKLNQLEGERNKIIRERKDLEYEKERDMAKSGVSLDGKITNKEKVELSFVEERIANSKIGDFLSQYGGDTLDTDPVLMLKMNLLEGERNKIIEDRKKLLYDIAQEEIERADTRRRMEFANLKTSLGADGRIDKHDSLMLKQMEIKQQQDRVKELSRQLRYEADEKRKEQIEAAHAEARARLGEIKMDKTAIETDLIKSLNVGGTFSAQVMGISGLMEDVQQKQLEVQRRIAKNTAVKSGTIKVGP